MIALACRGLPPRERLWGMVLGAGFAVACCIVFTGVVAIAADAALSQTRRRSRAVLDRRQARGADEPGCTRNTEAVEDLWRAVRIVVVADIVMSLDNVIAVAAAAGGNAALLVFGLAISIPWSIAGRR